MTSRELLAVLQERNIRLTANGDKLRYAAPQGALASGLLEEIRRHKEALLSVARYGHRAARLYPYIDHRVTTPDGPGRLVQVFVDRAAVVLPGGKVKHYSPNQIDEWRCER